MRREVRLDDAAVRCGQVGLRALIECAAAQTSQSRCQLFVGHATVEIDRGVIQQFHRAVYQSVDVVVACLCVLNKVQDILLCLLRGRDSFGFLERSVTRLGDGRQILFLDTGSRVFQSLKACEFRGVVCHLLAPLTSLCR